MRKVKKYIWLFGGTKEGHTEQGGTDDVTQATAVKLYQQCVDATATKEVCLEEFRGFYQSLGVYKAGPNGEAVCISDDVELSDSTSFEVCKVNTRDGVVTIETWGLPSSMLP